MAELDKKSDELAIELLARQKSQAGIKWPRNPRKQDDSVASEKRVAQALGHRAPIPSAVLPAKQASQKAKKDAANHRFAGQTSMDHEVLSSVRRSLNLFPSNSSCASSDKGNILPFLLPFLD